MKQQMQKSSKVLYLSVLMSLFCSFSVFAKNRIIPKTQMKMAPVVSPNLSPDQIQDNFEPAYQDNFRDEYQEAYQDNYQDGYQENVQGNYPEQNMQNGEDVAYLDREIKNPQAESDFVQAAPMPKYEENSAQLSDAQYAEPEFQN